MGKEKKEYKLPTSKYSEWRLVCLIPGRQMCFNGGYCEYCEWADKYEHPEKYMVS